MAEGTATFARLANAGGEFSIRKECLLARRRLRLSAEFSIPIDHLKRAQHFFKAFAATCPLPFIAKIGQASKTIASRIALTATMQPR